KRNAASGRIRWDSAHGERPRRPHRATRTTDQLTDPRAGLTPPGNGAAPHRWPSPNRLQRRGKANHASSTTAGSLRSAETHGPPPPAQTNPPVPPQPTPKAEQPPPTPPATTPEPQKPTTAQPTAEKPSDDLFSPSPPPAKSDDKPKADDKSSTDDLFK